MFNRMGDKLTKPKKHHPQNAEQLVVQALEDKKGVDIRKVPLPASAGIADFMIIASGTSNTHVETLAHFAVEALKQGGVPVYGVEGVPANQWVLVDAGYMVIHIFLPEVRQMYNLEKLWSHAFEEEGQSADWFDDHKIG